MNTEMRKRVFLYYSGLIRPIYELFKLKSSPVYAVQRFSSMKLLNEYHITPQIKDYELIECGLINGIDTVEGLTESIIQKRNIVQKRISVGDVIRVFKEGKMIPCFVDTIGITELSSF